MKVLASLLCWMIYKCLTFWTSSRNIVEGEVQGSNLYLAKVC